jgi:putative alpha-1,2-mannosidase
MPISRSSSTASFGQFASLSNTPVTSTQNTPIILPISSRPNATMSPLCLNTPESSTSNIQSPTTQTQAVLRRTKNFDLSELSYQINALDNHIPLEQDTLSNNSCIASNSIQDHDIFLDDSSVESNAQKKKWFDNSEGMSQKPPAKKRKTS